MSVLQFPEGMNPSADLQVWNNAAFDNGDSEDLTASRQSWGSLKSVFGNPKSSFDSVSGKENHGPPMENQISPLSSSKPPFKSVNIDGVAVEKSRIKGDFKKGFIEEKSDLEQKGFRDEKKIDEEIEQIESEISRLNSRLEALKLEKIARRVKIVEKRGRIVSAKFMDQKNSVKIGDDKKKIEEISSLSAKPKVQRRGLSLGPAEIVASGRRGMSLGPAEIFGGAKSKQSIRQEMVTPLQSRRKSCFFKLPDINEEKLVNKVRGMSSSLSPKSRKLATKNQVSSRQAVTTIASKKVVKKEDTVTNLIQPKKLFKDGEKSVPATNKKPLRPGRVVASRYNQSINQASAVRKRSLPENENDEGKRFDKKRSLSIGKSGVDDASESSKNLGTESRVKKRWEIPSEIVVHSSVEDENSPDVIVPNLLPSIRIGRLLVNESPRDSGPAKRVAELVGRKSFFANDEVETSVCQALSYAEEEEFEES